MNPKKLVVLLLVVAAVITFIALDLGRYLTLDYLKQSQATLAGLYQRQPFAVGAIYFAVYVVATALSLPGAVILTLAGGAIFGLGWGLLIVSFASSAGATLAFLAARFVLRDSIEARFGNRLAEVNRGIEKDGAFYQARASTAPATGEGGKGLGLAIVKRIAELHGGSVAVVSHEGQGTAVTLTLPARQAGPHV